MTNLRYISACIINNILQGYSLTDCLPKYLVTLTDARDRAFVQAVCYGVCRFYPRLNFLLQTLMQKPLKQKDRDVYALLLIGLYQLSEMQVPAHAAISETVNAVDNFKKSWARGLVNAVLREYTRKKGQLSDSITQDQVAYFAHPKWLINKIKQAWPMNWEEILIANNEHPPFALRINQRKITRHDYIQLLSEAEIAADILPATDEGIILPIPIPIEAVPGFLAGQLSVQDGAAQLAAHLLNLKPNLRILDACAAPGGKLMHILESEVNLKMVIALEKDLARIISINENLNRLHLESDKLKIICQDAKNINAWWDGVLFDRILLDAPCSASGVIRRHPDIKLLRQPEDVASLCQEQWQLLTTLWPLLATGGSLLYATCSIFPEENNLLMEKFLAAHTDARAETLDASWGTACRIGRQILPGHLQMDGFYYARLQKI